ncbi:hypothetical protein AALB16_06705 [Lachnospiraceae bacterium 62-35]
MKRRKRNIAVLFIDVVFIAFMVGSPEYCLGENRGEGSEGMAWEENGDRMILTSQLTYDIEQISEPELMWEEEDGTVYQLESWEIKEIEEEGRRESVKETEVYYGLESAGVISDTKVISSVDERTGRKVITEGKKTKVYALEEWWMEKEISFVCYLGKGSREAGEKELILYNELVPPKEACQEMLKKTGISNEEFIIDHILWEGEIFESQDGNLCRRVKVKGRKKVKDYQVEYEGTAIYPPITCYQYQAEYIRQGEIRVESEEGREGEEIGYGKLENVEELPDSVSMERSPKEAEMEKEDEMERKKARKERVYRLVKETVVVTITIGLPVLFTAFFLWLISVMRNKKK